MCDYSLMGVQNRLAVEGEELVTHRFGTGTIGLASVADIDALQAWNKAQNQTGIKATVKKMVIGSRPVVCAICVPPGATLGLVQNGRVRQQVKFDQLSERVNNYRDAIRIDANNATLLQEMQPGIRMNVLSLEGVTEREEVQEGLQFVNAR